jgi:hypothetical protein
MERVGDPMQLWVGTWGATPPAPQANRRQSPAGATNAPEAPGAAPAEEALDRPEAR